jgi:hypothetical protein
MSLGVIRSWQCLNRRCGHQFESGERYPECPRCKCVRVDWIPGGGHVGSAGSGIDRELRTLVDAFKLPDVANARHGEKGQGAKIPAAAPSGNYGTMNFAPGFSAPITPGAVCVPAPNVGFKVKTGVGDSRGAFSAKQTPFTATNDLRGHTRIEGRHKP